MLLHYSIHTWSSWVLKHWWIYHGPIKRHVNITSTNEFPPSTVWEGLSCTSRGLGALKDLGWFRSQTLSTWTKKRVACPSLLLMEEILHQLIGRLGSLSHDLQGLIHLRWCRISAINSISVVLGLGNPFKMKETNLGLNLQMDMPWLWPPPSNSDHQECSIFSRASL